MPCRAACRLGQPAVCQNMTVPCYVKTKYLSCRALPDYNKTLFSLLMHIYERCVHKSAVFSLIVDDNLMHRFGGPGARARFQKSYR